jgi:hypothetical protein
MPLSQADLYKAHVENLRAIDSAYSQVGRELRSCIARELSAPADALLKTQMLLLGAWAEVRLLKLLHEPSGFVGIDRQSVQSQSSQILQWKKTVELGFRRRYGVPTAALSRSSLPLTAFACFNEINCIIDVELAPIIELRNKLAHGQWARAFNNEMNAISSTGMMRLANENALSLAFKKQMTEALSQLTHDLVASPAAFERDFNRNYGVLHQAKTNLQSRSYAGWRSQLVDRLKRGRLKRQASQSPTVPSPAQ